MPINPEPDDKGAYRGTGAAATLWEAPNYRGRSLSLPPGRHVLPFSPSSLQMPGRVEVVLYEARDGSGASETFKASTAYVGARNDRAQAADIVALDHQVQAPPPAPGVPPPWSGQGQGQGAAPRPDQAEARRWYAEGYEDGAAGRASRFVGEAPVPVPWDRFYYEAGYLDAKAGQPRRSIELGTPPPTAADRNAPPPPTWRHPWDPTVGYELCAYFSLFRDPDVFGKAVPLEIAQVGGMILAGFSFVLLGEDPSDWGPNGRGFRLSGPRGKALALAAQRYPGQLPGSQQLPAWIAIMTLKGPRLLSRATLDSLLSPNWA